MALSSVLFGRCRPLRERHLKIEVVWLCKMFANFCGIKFVIKCLHAKHLLQNISFHVMERTRTAAECIKMKIARAKRAKNMLVIKYANL